MAIYLDKVKEHLEELKLLSPNELSPCKPDELIWLEQQLGISLPKAYKKFLFWMGHGAGQFLRGSDCFFKHLLGLQEWAVELLQENNFPEPLPEDAFVFCMHKGINSVFSDSSKEMIRRLTPTMRGRTKLLLLEAMRD